MIIDGFGISETIEGNAISMADTPNWDKILREYPNALLEASGNAVGLPEGVMGNSEVGHLTIGAGRIQFQSYEKINQVIKQGKLETWPQLMKFKEKCENSNGRVHLMGLVSYGGVHSHMDHLKALIQFFEKQDGIKEIFVHAFTDGRDVSPNSSINDLEELQRFLERHEKTKLVDVIGRYYAMDRDKRWERNFIAYQMLTDENRKSIESSLTEEIQRRYDRGETDEFLKPIVIHREGTIKDGDGILFFNFRPDRARQLTSMFLFPEQHHNLTLKTFDNLIFATMTEYDKDYPVIVLFPEETIKMTLSEQYSVLGLKQLHIAKTEKYAHVTYFINGGREAPFPNEDRILVPSKRHVATYDLLPEMSTREVAQKVVEGIEGRSGGKQYDLIICNFASPDMVGHTGNLEATVKAVEILDEALGEIANACLKHKYILIITADHGNAEKMLDDQGRPFTAHTTNPVPFVVMKPNVKIKETGGLSNVAPTLLELAGLPKPVQMEANSLVINKE